MPEFQAELRFDHPPQTVFDFHCTPANLVRLLPADAPATLLEAPDKLVQLSEFEIRVSAWGMSQVLRFAVQDLDAPLLIVTRQLKGPFRQWQETHRFESSENGTKMLYQVRFEPPGGMIGLMVTTQKILSNLELAMPYRQRRTAELLAGAA